MRIEAALEAGFVFALGRRVHDIVARRPVHAPGDAFIGVVLALSRCARVADPAALELARCLLTGILPSARRAEQSEPANDAMLY